jgi:Fic family protein
MKWNWERKDWPKFRYDKEAISEQEKLILRESGTLLGAFKHLTEDQKQSIKISVISEEALKTSEIEGEYLDRSSLQSSIRKQLGLQTDKKQVPPAERGVAEMMIQLYHNFDIPLSVSNLHKWNKLLLQGRREVEEIGIYRTSQEPMQIVSGSVHDPKVHFVAPPSNRVASEMKLFLDWFENTKDSFPILLRAGIAHSWFVAIHPYEDGNGRIGRAISEKSMAEQLGQPTLIALSRQIEQNKKAYYESLATTNHTNEITDWLVFFANTILEAQRQTQSQVDFIIKKAHFFDAFKDKLNPRQEKVLNKLFKEGPSGFKGGLSAENYISIAKTSRATATRDLQDLLSKGALCKTGELKYTRYFLDIDSKSGRPI